MGLNARIGSLVNHDANSLLLGTQVGSLPWRRLGVQFGVVDVVSFDYFMTEVTMTARFVTLILLNR
jgi:hypothetical protein